MHPQVWNHGFSSNDRVQINDVKVALLAWQHGMRRGCLSPLQAFAAALSQQSVAH